MNKSILIVEDEKILRISLTDALREEGYTVFAATNGREALVAIEQGIFSVIITDIRLPDISGMEILRKSMEIAAAVPVVMMTGYGNIKDAVESMRIGAFDYITKPFDLEEMFVTVSKALEVNAITEENIRLKKELSSQFSAGKIIGESKAMQSVFALLDKVSRTESTVLLLGESGTGKELVASTIHYQSARKKKAIIRVNCAALPDDLIESELFGYEKGAFTGADGKKPGRFDMADGGTLFLDEIGDLPPLTQTKILRFLEEKTFERLGSTSTVSVDVRIIAATNKNLEREVSKGMFREDLYYRLNVIPVILPPLRKRIEDIPLLLDSFTRKFNDQFGTNVVFGADAVTELSKYGFPGNVRELLNIVERCIALASNKIIGRNDLPVHILQNKREKVPLLSLQQVSVEAEKNHILKILSMTQGNRSKAAEILGVSRKTLWEKINNYNLNV
ncbi:sigma-54 dependent transcriptional regulator [Desulforhopalus sp. IMCC35007]|uniref:sigma-54-dependent transcriptional regulator n=1 Tax=Desulforhopalus sp. IMCC35007 TaxID=2569543 RepID=UPI0010AED584|nr:sigma-54 dependent transcriptional regulator [Desulforhopalus sp. IMCC35007]TKB10425.1 sigma-54-dependent Fis family transcriptional regulator [Desulforhopalus sp. IMCC35007]